jgi:hypothetical protein
MAYESEIPPAESSPALCADGVDSSGAAGLILASPGDTRRVRPGMTSEILPSEAPADPLWREAETLLTDAELIVKATGQATAHLLKEIYVNDWLREH